MSSMRRHSRLLLVAVCCIAVGAGISAIASAGAATSANSASAKGASAKSASAKSASAKSASAKGAVAHAKGRQGGLRRLARAVQGSAVVHTKDGFTTLTFERGKVVSVSGSQLTLSEGTPKATYKTVTVTIPADAAVRDDRQKASLSDVKAGQRVLVLDAPRRTIVIARTPKG